MLRLRCATKPVFHQTGQTTAIQLFKFDAHNNRCLAKPILHLQLIRLLSGREIPGYFTRARRHASQAAMRKPLTTSSTHRQLKTEHHISNSKRLTLPQSSCAPNSRLCYQQMATSDVSLTYEHCCFRCSFCEEHVQRWSARWESLTFELSKDIFVRCKACGPFF